MTPRRYLPSISMLTAFEAVCRTGSAAAAARELCLTQGAVSRLLQALEGQLGRELFVRERKRLVATEIALNFAVEIRKALNEIARASLAVTGGPDSGTLNLAILPAFGTRWLAPRLSDFLQKHPGITLNLATRLSRTDLENEGFDAAIHFGEANWPDAEHQKLCDEQAMAVCSPSYLSSNAISAATDLANLSLLHLETRPNAWTKWFEIMRADISVPRGMMFDQFAPMVAAALHGAGIALLPTYLIQEELKNETLVPLPLGRPFVTGSYYLVWSPKRASHLPLRVFREWIARQFDIAFAATEPNWPKVEAVRMPSD